MPENIIRVSSENKITTLRVTEKTKKMLDALSIGKETHEAIILRLIKLADRMWNEKGTRIEELHNMIGTKYERLNKNFFLDLGHGTKTFSHKAVCSYNDLSILSMFRIPKLKHQLKRKEDYHWEVDLKVVNILSRGKHNWIDPVEFKSKNPRKFQLIYFACLKQILEETFDINLFNIMIEDDYLSVFKWEKAYKDNDLSMESFYNDVEKKMRN